LHTFLALCALAAAAAIARAQFGHTRAEPREGQFGKDAIWVPTPPVLVERMLDVARVTSADYVIDLGSGDGRIAIAAARRGARALGVEYDAELIEVSRRGALAGGVADRVTFVQGDLFEADLSQATVVTLFLLPDTLRRLSAKLRALAPGTRIVTNRFEIEGWPAGTVSRIGGNSASDCTAVLYVVS
jgi:SAM-dependent methyltransferase